MVLQTHKKMVSVARWNFFNRVFQVSTDWLLLMDTTNDLTDTDEFLMTELPNASDDFHWSI